MAVVLSKKAVPRYEKPTLEDQAKGCGICLEECIGHKNCKTKKNTLKSKIMTFCYKCKQAVCSKHTVVTCQICHGKNT